MAWSRQAAGGHSARSGRALALSRPLGSISRSTSLPLEPHAPRHSYLVAPAMCGVHLQPYVDTEMAYFHADRRELAGARRELTGEQATWQMKTRQGFLPAGLRWPRPRFRRYIRGRKLGREQQSPYRRKS